MKILRPIFIIVAIFSIIFTITIAILLFFIAASTDTFEPECGNFYSHFAGRTIQFPIKLGEVSKNENLIYDGRMAHSDFDKDTTVFTYSKNFSKTADTYSIVFQFKALSKTNIDTLLVELEEKYGQKFQKKQDPYNGKDKYYYHLKLTSCTDLIVNTNKNSSSSFPKSKKETTAFVGFFYRLNEHELNAIAPSGGALD